jgi:uncharacterized OsmC-like protein
MPTESDKHLTAQRAHAKARGGLAVDVDVGEQMIRSDLPAARGGTATGPAPGHLMRASVAACLAIGYRQWGARLGVAIDDVEVDLTTEIDMTGQEGASGVLPGWQSIRWHVRVVSGAADAEVERVLAQAEAVSPMLDTLHPRCTRTRTFEVHHPE